MVNLLLKEVNVNSNESTGSTNVKGLDILQKGKIFKITLNRPEKFNALTWQMYEAFTSALEIASKDRNTSVTVITGF